MIKTNLNPNNFYYDESNIDMFSIALEETIKNRDFEYLKWIINNSDAHKWTDVENKIILNVCLENDIEWVKEFLQLLPNEKHDDVFHHELYEYFRTIILEIDNQNIISLLVEKLIKNNSSFYNHLIVGDLVNNNQYEKYLFLHKNFVCFSDNDQNELVFRSGLNNGYLDFCYLTSPFLDKKLFHDDEFIKDSLAVIGYGGSEDAFNYFANITQIDFNKQEHKDYGEYIIRAALLASRESFLPFLYEKKALFYPELSSKDSIRIERERSTLWEDLSCLREDNNVFFNQTISTLVFMLHKYEFDKIYNFIEEIENSDCSKSLDMIFDLFDKIELKEKMELDLSNKVINNSNRIKI